MAWEILVYGVNKGFWFRKELFFFVVENYLRVFEKVLLFYFCILVYCRIVFLGCYFGYRKLDGFGIGCRGGGVG